jgi:hypothetical protein
MQKRTAENAAEEMMANLMRAASNKQNEPSNDRRSLMKLSIA